MNVENTYKSDGTFSLILDRDHVFTLRGVEKHTSAETNYFCRFLKKNS